MEHVKRKQNNRNLLCDTLLFDVKNHVFRERYFQKFIPAVSQQIEAPPTHQNKQKA